MLRNTMSHLSLANVGVQIIQYKQLVGNQQDASVRHDIDHAVDSVMQQLRLQVTFSSHAVILLQYGK